VPPLDQRFADDRLYYVLRDLVSHGKLTILIRDPTLEDIEASRVDEREKVLPRADLGHDGRAPTNLSFEDESAFVNVVTQLAADAMTPVDLVQRDSLPTELVALLWLLYDSHASTSWGRQAPARLH